MSRPMIPSERGAYSAIVDRPPLKLPGGARVAFWTIVNYEVWDIGRPMPRQVLPAPTGVPLFPDVPHWSWHEYGTRVGAWRFFELYERLGIRPTLAINARTCEDYARVAVPMHFEQFAFNTEPPDAFAAACKRLGQPYRVLRAGEQLTLPMCA